MFKATCSTRGCVEAPRTRRVLRGGLHGNLRRLVRLPVRVFQENDGPVPRHIAQHHRGVATQGHFGAGHVLGILK